MVVDVPCEQCHGSGRGQRPQQVSARIPAGVSDSSKIRVKGKGAPGESGGPDGDLYLVVRVAPDPVFARSGDHVTVKVPVTFSEAALGAEIPVPLPRGGRVTVKIPPGTSAGSKFRVRGRGAARRDGTFGDVLVTPEVVVPTKLSAAARAAVAEFATATAGDDPRQDLFALADREQRRTGGANGASDVPR
jgi:molecular chaperone DnaJ